jgi:cysteine desulfurase
VKVVDALGTWCPVPLRLLDRAMATLGDGDLVTVLADDPMIQVDLPAWCYDTGHELLALDEEPGGFRGIVRRRVA